jgi:hypothetical protein
MQRENDITPGRAALRDFKPAYVGSGSQPELPSTGPMSALASCGHNALLVYRRCVPILLQKSQIARSYFFAAKKIHRRPLIRVPSIALPRSSVSLSSGDEAPPHLYTKIACTAKINFDDQGKRTFATKSAIGGPSALQ